MKPRTVLITGCSSGIGRALADELKARGAVVYATARKAADVEALSQAGFVSFPLDVTSADDVAAAAGRIRDDVGHLDVLINNAGFNAVGPVLDIPADKLRSQFETNVVGPMELTRACFELLRDRDARVVNVGSVVGILATPFAGIYSASKAALHRLSEVLRLELAPFDIHVILVQPGAIRSSMGDNALANATIDLDSAWAPLAARIEERARLSQENRPTPAGDFANHVVRRILAPRPPSVIRYGRGSAALPILERWVPTRLRDGLLSRRFGLDQL